jgi:hypothetical protein
MKSAFLMTVALGTLYLGGAAFAASMHTQVFTGSGTFTVPSNATSAQEFLFTVVGGGGGAGGCDGSSISAGGGSGGAGFASFKGFTASDTVTVTIGGGGSAGSGGSNGGNGSGSSLTYSSITVVSATGGSASLGATGGTVTDPGAAGSFTASAGASGLTLVSSLNYQAASGTGIANISGQFPDLGDYPGGGNPIGHPGTYTNHNGVLGGGGVGCFDTGATAGGAGGSGVVIVTWVQ